MSERAEAAINWNQQAPYAFIQWKGTNVCADIHCACGAQIHFDGGFMYAVKCPHCGAEWAVEPFVRLVENNDDYEPILLADDDEDDYAAGVS